MSEIILSICIFQVNITEIQHYKVFSAHYSKNAMAAKKGAEEVLPDVHTLD